MGENVRERRVVGGSAGWAPCNNTPFAAKPPGCSEICEKGVLSGRRGRGAAPSCRPPLVPYGCIMFSVRLSSPIADRADSMKARVANDDFG